MDGVEIAANRDASAITSIGAGYFVLNAIGTLAPPSAVGAHSGLAGPQAEPSIAFGPFRLCPRQPLLREGDKPLPLGSRALQILIALPERQGELVNKQELVARGWPGIVVTDSNLKVQMAALRRTLRDGQVGNRHICTASGRDNCFVAPVARSDAPIPAVATERLHNLQAPLTPLFCGGDLVGMFAGRNPIPIPTRRGDRSLAHGGGRWPSAVECAAVLGCCVKTAQTTANANCNGEKIDGSL